MTTGEINECRIGRVVAEYFDYKIGPGFVIHRAPGAGFIELLVASGEQALAGPIAKPARIFVQQLKVAHMDYLLSIALSGAPLRATEAIPRR
jgi:hypothetical protein